MQALELATGKRTWRASYPAPYTMNSAATGHGKGPKSTPAVAGGRVFTFGIGGILSAFDAATGRLAWRKEHGLRVRPGLPALRRRPLPRRRRWQRDRPRGRPRKGRAHGLRRGDGRRPLGLEGRRAGLRLAGGGHDRRRAAGRDLQRVVPRGGLGRPRRAPLEDPLHDTVGAERGHAGRGRRPCRLLRPRPPLPRHPGRAERLGLDDGAALGEPGRRRLHERRRCSRAGGSTASPTARSGQLFCLDAATGKVVWLSEGRLGDNAALVAGGGAVFALTTEADLLVLPQKGDAFAPARRYRVAPSPTWAHPVVTGEGVLVKDRDSLAYLRF